MRKKRNSVVLAAFLICGIISSSAGVYADTQSDAIARVQINGINRINLSNGLSGSSLTSFDLLAHKYVYENFDNWGTERATHVGGTYEDITWSERAKMK